MQFESISLIRKGNSKSILTESSLTQIDEKIKTARRKQKVIIRSCSQVLDLLILGSKSIQWNLNFSFVLEESKNEMHNSF